MNDADLLDQLAEDFLHCQEMLHLAITPLTAFRLVGMLQLASRHRGPSADNREAVRWFIAHVRAHFAECPGVLEVIRRGDDPAHDVPS